MWWLPLLLAGMEPADTAPQIVAADAMGLSEMRRADVRCVMLAGLVMDEVRRGVSKKAYGLTTAKAEKLAGLLADIIIAETGADAAQLRALFHQDFEVFSAQAVAFADYAARQASFDAAMATCQPLFDSMTFSKPAQAATGG